MVYFVFHLMTVRTVWYILFFIWWHFEWCGIFCFSFDDSSNGVVYFVFHFMTFRTVWYILFSFYTCSNGAVCFVFHFMTFRTVWYILFFISWQFERCGIFSFSFYSIFERCGIFCFSFDDNSNGVVYFVFHFMTVRTVWYILFFIIWQLNGAVYLVLHFITVRMVWYILFFIW